MIKKSTIVLASLLVLGISQGAIAGPKKLKKFDDVVDSLQDGNLVRAVIDFDKCSLANNTMKLERRKPVGGLSFSKFMKYDTDVDGKKTTVVATTETMLVNSEKYGLVYDRLSMHMMSDGSVEFVSELIDPKNYVQVGEMVYNCAFNKDKGSVMMFEVS